MKKALSMLLAVIMVLTLMVGCGDKNNGGQQETKTYPESFAGMEDLIAAAQAEGELTVYGGCEEEYLGKPSAPVHRRDPGQDPGRSRQSLC